MKKIWQVFLDDLHAVFTNIWATIIVIGIMIIPALYAWFNIDSNWDPYGATSGIKIAVANADTGAETEGMDLNIGGMIVDQLAKNDAIGWSFESKEDALNGVSDGTYYAAVVIPEDFSSSISSIASLVVNKPQIQYYVNEKKNAIAPKITNSGINTVQVQVNQAIVETAASVLGTVSQDAVGTLNEKGSATADEIVESLQTVNSSLDEYQTLISTVSSAVDALQSSIDAANALLPQVNETLDHASQASQNAQSLLEDSKTTADVLSSSMEAALDTGQNMARTIQNMAQDTMNLVEPAANSAADGTVEKLDTLLETTQALKSYNDKITGTFETLQDAANGKLSMIGNLTSKLEDRSQKLDDLESEIRSARSTVMQGQALASSQKRELTSMAQEIDGMSGTLDDIMKDTVKPQLDNLYDSLDATLEDLSDLGQNEDLTSSISTSVSSMKDALTSSSDALSQTAGLMSNVQNKINGYIDAIQQARENEKLLKVEELLQRDPELVAAFMKEPVAIQTISVFPIENYGSGMAPFYTTLAIWVGALVNCALIKTRIKRSKEMHLTPNQEYFGRYLFFAFVSICQALIICLGDLWIMHIQCLNPFLFCFMGVITAINFSLLMYTLTVSFGDVGKAIAVILMVIQVAGSGGTFPIDILPQFYRSLYPFYPFNYAINGMRECIAGIYQNAYWIDVAKELCFIPISLLIGLVLRKPIIRMKEYIEERIEKTGFIG